MTSRDDSGDYLIRELQRLRVTTHNVLPSVEPLPSHGRRHLLRLRTEPREPHSLADRRGPRGARRHSPADRADLGGCAGGDDATGAVLARPFTSNAILASLVVARSQFRYEPAAARKGR